MYIQPSDDFEIGSILAKLKMKRTCYIGGISTKVLECCEPVIKKYLLLASNKCIGEGFPQILQR